MARKKIVRAPVNHTREIANSVARERPDLDPSDYLYLIFLTRLGRILDRVDDQHCRKDFGVSGADVRVLFALRRAGKPYALRPTELFRSLLVTSGAITKQVDRLVAAGLVERRSDPTHSGGFLIHLTKKGVKVADDAFTSLTRASSMSAERSSLSARERDTLATLCEKMLLDLEPRLEEG